MKRLIVNADDLGADEDRNAGIFEAINAGVITSVSILPNGPALKDALTRVRSLDPNNISLGLHFNLSEGQPLSPGLRLLTGPNGCFLGKKSSQRLFANSQESELDEEIRRELDAQFSMFRSAGVHLDHLDGHQHVHILPGVAGIVADAAKAYGIRWIRIPEEPANEFQATFLSANDGEEARFFSGHAAKARPLLHGAGFLTPDHFRGLNFKGRLPAGFWTEFLEAIPDGVTEFMVHPGHAAGDMAIGPFSRFSTPDREKELAALTDGRFGLALLKSGFKLTPFPAVPVS
jgi:chitin disaccharide deacetylase